MAPVIALVDLSKSSLDAAKYAADMAAALPTKLIMVHVVQLTEVCLSLSNDEMEFYKIREKHTAWLNELKKHLLARTDNKIVIDNIKLLGEPESELEKFCGLHQPMVLVGGLNMNLHNTHPQSDLDITGLSENSKCALLTIPSNTMYKEFRRITVVVDPNQSNIENIISSVRKWANLFNNREPEIHVRHYIKFGMNDLISKDNSDLLVNATWDKVSYDGIVQSIQFSSRTENHAPAILSIGEETLSGETFSRNFSYGKDHDCSVCNGACRIKKNVHKAEETFK